VSQHCARHLFTARRSRYQEENVSLFSVRPGGAVEGESTGTHDEELDAIGSQDPMNSKGRGMMNGFVRLAARDGDRLELFRNGGGSDALISQAANLTRGRSRSPTLVSPCVTRA
jgi:hypothetical protein